MFSEDKLIASKFKEKEKAVLDPRNQSLSTIEERADEVPVIMVSSDHNLSLANSNSATIRHVDRTIPMPFITRKE